MRPLNIPSSSPHSATPVRGHPMPYGAPAPASYPYYAMPPHSHMPHPPPGYALMPVGDRQSEGNPVSPEVQGHMTSKQHQFSNHGRSPHHHGTPSSATRKRTPTRTKQESPPPFNPSTGTHSQRVSHPSPLRSAYAPGKLDGNCRVHRLVLKIIVLISSFCRFVCIPDCGRWICWYARSYSSAYSLVPIITCVKAKSPVC